MEGVQTPVASSREKKVCGTCRSEFTSQSNLNRHVETKHTDQNTPEAVAKRLKLHECRNNTRRERRANDPAGCATVRCATVSLAGPLCVAAKAHTCWPSRRAVYTRAVYTLGVPLYTGATVKVAIVKVATVKVATVKVATVKVASQTVLQERRAVEVWQGLVLGF
jgi:hypothetical protein